MKRADLHAGMIVENKGGGTYVVVDTGGWQKFAGYRIDATGVTYAGIPIRSAARSVPVHGNVGVLVVAQHLLHGVQEGDPTMGSILVGEAMQPGRMFPSGHHWQSIRDRQAAREAYVAQQTEGDRELVSLVHRYWGDKADHLLQVSHVHIDDNGRLNDLGRATVVTIILCGQNR